MSTSPYRASDAVSEAEFDLLAVDEPAYDVEPFDQFADESFDDSWALDRETETAYPAEDVTSYADDSYERGPRVTQPRSTVYAALPGMPGRGVIMLTGLSTLVTAGLDFALTGGLTYFFDLSFVVVCLVAAIAVRGHDLFTVGVLPPLIFGATIAVVAAFAPETITTTGGASRVFLTGLTTHAGALAFGYGTALAAVAGRALHHRHR